jgi:hypothetical protein
LVQGSSDLFDDFLGKDVRLGKIFLALTAFKRLERFKRLEPAAS